MKKVSAVILAFIMLFAVSSSAFAAVSSVQAPTVSAEITTDLPEIVKTELEVKPVTDLNPAQQEVYTAAIEKLAEAVPEGTTAQNLFYASAPADTETTTSITLDMSNIKALETKQFIGENWVELKVTEGNDGIYTVTTVGETPSHISFRLDSETNCPSEQLINGEWVEIKPLENESGIYTVVVSNAYPASVTMKLDNEKTCRAMQFVGGEWIEIEMVQNPDGTYTLTVDNPGFVAIISE